jgi:phospholipid/cholesterol/gamma-HCH transport system substrate-binding protein
LDNLIKGYNGVVSERDRDNFKQFILNLRDASASLKTKVDDDLGSIITDMKKVSSKSADLEESITQLKASSESLKTAAGRFDKILAKIENGEGTLGKMINDPSLYDNLNEFSEDAKKLIQEFKDNPTKYMKAYWKGKK